MTEKSGKRILLHACCGPCAIMPALRLQDEGYEVVLHYINPNIHPLSEYLRRREALLQCAARLGAAVICDDEAWDLPAWLSGMLPLARSPERCARCCGSRLESSFAKAASLGWPAFTSSLLYSRYQPHDAVAEKGRALEREGGPKFIYRDFRADWQKGIELSKEWGLYRQPYCGCVFSEAERYAKKFSRIKKEPFQGKTD